MIELLPLIYMTVFLIHVYMITASQIALQFFFKTGDNFDYRYIQNGFNFNCIYFYWNLAKKPRKPWEFLRNQVHVQMYVSSFYVNFIFITLWFHTQSRYCVQYKSTFTNI